MGGKAGDGMWRPSVLAFSFVLASAALGFLANYYPFTIFFGQGLYFGSVFGILALLFLGRAGGGAALGAAVLAVAIRGDWAYLACASAEAAFLCVAFGGRRRSVAILDAAYWLGAGFWIALAARLAGGAVFQEALLSSACFSICGLASAALAGLTTDYLRAAVPGVLSAAGLDSAREIPFRRIVFESSVVLGLVPLLALLVIASHSRMTGLGVEIGQRLKILAHTYAMVSEVWVDEKESELSSIAAAAASGPGLGARLESLRSSESSILAAGVLDSSGRVIRSSAEPGSSGLSPPRIDLSRTEADISVLASGEPSFGVAAVDGDMPRLIVLKALAGGLASGAVFIAVDPSPLSDLLAGLTLPQGAEAVIIDSGRRVLASSAGSKPAFAAYPMPVGYVGISEIGRRGIEAEGYYYECDSGLGSGWQAIFSVSVEPYRIPVIATGLVMALFSLGMAAVILVASLISSKLLVGTIEGLRLAADRLVERADTGQAIVLPQGKVAEVASLSRTMTAAAALIIRRYREAYAAMIEAEKASAEKERLLEAVSHDIRGPLSGMIEMARVLEGELEGRAAREHALLIEDAGVELRDFVEELLDRAAIETGRMELRDSPFDLRLLVHGVVRAYRSLAVRKRIELANEFDEQIPRHVVGDRARLYQAVGNLLGNAIKYTENGFVRVSVKLSRIEGGRAFVRFAVEDSGPGISADKLDRVFEPYFRAGDDSGLGNVEGRGLGLAIADEIVELMGGELRVESELGKGSRFGFELGLAIVERADQSPTALAAWDCTDLDAPVPAGAREGCASAKALVADDQRINRALARRYLEDAGHSVEEAADGRAAVDAALASDFDIALLDLSMPRLGGREAAREIIERFRAERPGRRRPYLVALSASSTEDDRKTQILAGFDDYIAKPASPERLRETVASALAYKETPLPARATLLDYEGLLEAYRGDRDFFKTILKAFVSDGTSHVAELRSVAEPETASREILLSALHSLVNIMGAGRAQSAFELLRGAERTIREAESVDPSAPIGPALVSASGIVPAITEAERAIAEAEARLEEELKS